MTDRKTPLTANIPFN